VSVPQTARESLSLNILNSDFTPDAAGILQAHVNAASAELATNPSIAADVLSDKELAHFLNPNSDFYEATWGKAVERLAARQIADNPLSDSILQHIGGPYEPDFVGRGGTFAEDQMFDVTTVDHEAAHYDRWYGKDVYYIHYWRP
jgi:hypothetical protein